MPRSHQAANARAVARAGAARVIAEARLTPDALVGLVYELLNDAGRRAALAAAAQRLMPHDAADRIARALLELVAR
jgi:UDP-N-acetylglucosamine--N-acetylmuramyl-(pentapeptide) pyrophosphoryl-undecaprenol N-acetylglucosamine transferase